MDKERFNKLIVEGGYRWEHRDLLVSASLANNELIIELLENIARVDAKDSVYSARILELSVKKNLDVVLPNLEQFCGLLRHIKRDGSLRACAKIIELLCIAYFVKYKPTVIAHLDDKILETFTEVGFDWMITDKAIAIQAHAMYSLYLLGHKFDWIHDELVLVINQHLPDGSIGYKNRGRKVIRAIQTGTLLKLY